MNRVLTRIAFSITLLFLGGIVLTQNTYAQSTDQGNTAAPNTKAVVDRCLNSGGTPKQCVEEGAAYLRGIGFPDTKAICGTELCFIVCANGATISVPNTPPPPPPPPPAPAPPPSSKCVEPYCTFGNRVTRCDGSYTTCPTGQTCTGAPGAAKCTTSSPPPPPGNPPPAPPPPQAPPPPPPPPPPPFNEAMCKCDNIEFTPITLGQKTTITAFGKVEGTDTQFAKIPSFRFAFYGGTDAGANVLQRQTVTATQIENTQTKARYQAVWELQIPNNLDASKVYRIQATPSCVRKTASLPPPVNPTTAVLAATDENTGFFASIAKFFAGLFGGSREEQEEGASVQDTVAVPTQQPNLQIGTFKPLIATKGTDANNCSFIRLQFAQ